MNPIWLTIVIAAIAFCAGGFVWPALGRWFFGGDA